MYPIRHFALLLIATFLCELFAGYEAPVAPFAPAAGTEGSTAIPMDDARIVNWASQVHSITFGEDVAEEWRNPDASLGPPNPSGMDVTVLGRSGEIILWFPDPVVDGEGFDFAIFENSFSDTFLELAYVEVSTDGEHFVRFPNYSLTAGLVPAFGDINPTLVYGYGGKYEAGYGAPFDLAELASVYDGIIGGYEGFSSEYRDAFVANFPYVDVNDVQYIRIIDIQGDGSQNDCEGYPVYDPYKTIITAGFDLDAVGILNQSAREAISFDDWSNAYSLDPVRIADSDNDGWSQFLEYYFGSDPADPGSKPDIEIQVETDGSLVLTHWYRHNADNAPAISVSTNGSDWHQPAPEDVQVRRLDQRREGAAVFNQQEITLQVDGGIQLARFLAAD
ncbi:MAG: hypothetical protein AB3N63_01095 [Puniceicoccaceae bacterium]